MFSLNVIGAGRVGKTIGLLWSGAGIAQVQDVFCRSAESSRAAVQCIGEGNAVTSWDEVRPADVHLISVPDDALSSVAVQLAQRVDLEKSVVFHSSGWKTSRDLKPASDKGACVASVHPIKGFPDPVVAAKTFAGTFCGVEGDADALAVLRPAFETIGGVLVDIEADKKPLYHTATVIACNYVIGLASLAQQSLIASGIESNRALQILAPLLKSTAESVSALGPVKALTGPVVRGDASTVAAHMNALQEWDPATALTYADQARHLVNLARQAGTPEDALERINKLLD